VGRGLTVNDTTCWQPFEFVYVIDVFPAEIAVTSPVELTLATPVFEELHGAATAAVPDPVN